MAKTRGGFVEQIRVLLTVRRSAIKARVAVIRQIKSLLVTAPEPIRMRWAGSSEPRVIEDLAATRPGAPSASVSAATGQALRRLARRHQDLTSEINVLEHDLRDLVGRAAPAVIAPKGYGVTTTATLPVTTGSNLSDSD
ncbi:MULTISPECIES: hypothetical protein [Citricoccus]|uniref:hypothetical protein n=1 Tax=Citricoccus TaxID=169133 RepID=UPI000255EF35|nr:hypothetical protein [Citricoccus sp. CH26A]